MQEMKLRRRTHVQLEQVNIIFATQATLKFCRFLVDFHKVQHLIASQHTNTDL